MGSRGREGGGGDNCNNRIKEEIPKNTYHLYVGMQLDMQIQIVSNSTLTNDKSADGVGDQSS